MEKALGYGQRLRRLEGQVAVVTGGAQGIGKAIALRLAAEGATVAIWDTNTENGGQTVAEIASHGGTALFVSCDVREREQVRTAVRAVEAAYGSIKLLVNNAGIGRRAPFLDLDDEAWNTVIGVNLTGAFIVGQEVCRAIVRTGGGAVVNMGSISAFVANSELTPYSVSKAGMLALTKMMAFELAPQGIRVNAIVPGTIATEFVGKMLTAEAIAERERRIPMGRFGKPEEVAGTVAFLLSEDAGYVNGTTVLIDGGWLSGGIRA